MEPAVLINPADRDEWLKLRTQDITSTEVAALFGCSPYSTLYEVWHRKKAGDILTLDENERMFWGTRLQDAIASGVAEKQGWRVKRWDHYSRLEEARMGSSFDFGGKLATDPVDSGEVFILEIKNVDKMVFDKDWLVLEDGSYEAPVHIELQVQHQLAVSGHRVAYIGALVAGNTLVLIRRERDEAVIARIFEEVAKFWKSIDDNVEPAPDFARDAEFIISLYQHSEPGKMYDARGDAEFLIHAQAYKQAKEQIKKLDEEADGNRAWMMARMKDADKVVGDGFKISAGIVAETPVSYLRKAYRMFTLTLKKEKAQP